MSAAVAVEPKTGALTISIKQLRALVEPVMPAAGADRDLPVLTSVRIESSAKWLVAFATDRFVIAVQRIAAPDDEPWPAWSANVPTATLRNILSTFKPSYRAADPAIEMEVIDGDGLHVISSDSLLEVREASIVYPLQPGEFPKMGNLLRDALAATPAETALAFDPRRLARLLSKASGTVTLKSSAPDKPVVFTDGDDWIGALMPRKLASGSTEPDADWAAIFDAMGGKS